MTRNFRKEEECVCCGKTGCTSCDCEDLQEKIRQEKNIGRAEQ